MEWNWFIGKSMHRGGIPHAELLLQHNCLALIYGAFIVRALSI